MAGRLAILFAAALMLTAVESSWARSERPDRPERRERPAKPAAKAAASEPAAPAGAKLHEDADVVVWWQDASLAVPRLVNESQRGIQGSEPLRISAARNEREPFQIVLSPKRSGLVVESVT